MKAVAVKYIWLCLGMSIWTIKTVTAVFDLSKDCFDYSRSVVIVNFFVLMVISGLISIILTMLIICCCPLFIVSFNQLRYHVLSPGLGQHVVGGRRHVQRVASRPAPFNQSVQSRNYDFTRSLINALVHRKFSRQLNRSGIDQCCICMEKFHDGKDSITPLSHNRHHFFHTKCI